MMSPDRAPALEPASGVHVTHTSHEATTLSKRLWELDWSGVLPWKFGDVSVEVGSCDDAFPFIERHYPSIFGVENDRFYVEVMTEAKMRFWREMDIFVFRSKGAVIGIAAGHPTDWSTYYVRTLALLPEYREQRVSTSFGHNLAGVLRDVGVARWEAECSPANPAMVRLFVREGMIVTSTITTERWGTMLRFTKFIEPNAEKTFRKQFIYVPTLRSQPDL